jgi:hypothetical protein
MPDRTVRYQQEIDGGVIMLHRVREYMELDYLHLHWLYLLFSCSYIRH